MKLCQEALNPEAGDNYDMLPNGGDQRPDLDTVYNKYLNDKVPIQAKTIHLKGKNSRKKLTIEAETSNDFLLISS